MSTQRINKPASRWIIRLDRDDRPVCRTDDEVRVWPRPAFFLTEITDDNMTHYDLLEMAGDVADSDLDAEIDKLWPTVEAMAVDTLIRGGVAATENDISFSDGDMGRADEYCVRFWEVDVLPVDVRAEITDGFDPDSERHYVAAWAPALCHGSWFGKAPRPENAMDGEAQRCTKCGELVDPHVALVVVGGEDDIDNDKIDEAVRDLVDTLEDAYGFPIDLKVVA